MTLWRLKPHLFISETCLRCRIGAEKCSIGGLSFQFWLRLHIPNPMKIKLYSKGHNWTQFLSPTSEKLWNGATMRKIKVFERCWPVFVRWQSSHYSWLDFEETDFVQLNAPSRACWRPVRGRMSENRTFSGSHARQQVVYEGEKLQSVWPGKARRSTTSGHICDKCSQAFKWVRWHILLGGVVRQRPTSVVRSFYPPTNICPEAFLLDSIDFLHICFTSHVSKFYSLTNSFYQATKISGQKFYNFLQSFCICLYKVSV